MVRACSKKPSRNCPEPAMARKSGNHGSCKIWESGMQKNQTIKIIRMEIRSAQDVGRVLTSRKKNILVSFGVFFEQFCASAEHIYHLLRNGASIVSCMLFLIIVIVCYFFSNHTLNFERPYNGGSQNMAGNIKCPRIPTTFPP